MVLKNLGRSKNHEARKTGKKDKVLFYCRIAIFQFPDPTTTTDSEALINNKSR